MNNQKMRRNEKLRAKPDDEGKLISLKGHKRLMVKRTKEAKESRTSAILLRMFGAVLLVGAVSVWQAKYSIIPMTGLAMIGGILLAGIFKLAYPEGLDTSSKVHKYIALFFTAVVMLLMVNQPTAGYALMLLFGLVPASYLFGVVKILPGLKP